jgi:NADPH2:quinone reductase
VFAIRGSYLVLLFSFIKTFRPKTELMMKAIVATLEEGETRKTKLSIEQRPTKTLSANQLLIKVVASPIQPSDFLNSQGNFPHTSFPRVLGRDFAGTVVEPTSSPLHGKAVYGTSGPELSFTDDGAHAEYVVVSDSAVAEVPKDISMKQASALPVPWTTAYLALTRANATKGETVMVFGAGGAVGGAAVQLAKSSLFDSHVLTAGRGAKYDVDTLKDQELKASKDLTKGSGPNIVFDTTGDLNLVQAGLGQLAKGGRLASK